MEPGGPNRILNVLHTLPSVWCVMTSAFEGKRGGLLVQRVMVCANEPPAIAVSVPKGQRLATLIRDSHAFAINVLSPNQRLIIKKFREIQLPEPGAPVFANDPFDTIDVLRLKTGAPILARAIAAIDCEVMRHFDLEADYEVYVGMVMGAEMLNPVSESIPGREAHASANGAAKNGTGSHEHAPKRRGRRGVAGGAEANSETEIVTPLNEHIEAALDMSIDSAMGSVPAIDGTLRLDKDHA